MAVASKTPSKRATSKSASAAKKATASTRRKKKLDIFGVPPYKRARSEEYMNDAQLEHFQKILENWKATLMEEVDRTIDHLRTDSETLPDANDRASLETEFGLELKTRDRERKLVRKINAALERIADGSYGYCEKTGEEIGLARLEARPIATMSVVAQERYESAERHYGD